jgi:hypothetical protein
MGSVRLRASRNDTRSRAQPAAIRGAAEDAGLRKDRTRLKPPLGLRYYVHGAVSFSD